MHQALARPCVRAACAPLARSFSASPESPKSDLSRGDFFKLLARSLGFIGLSGLGLFGWFHYEKLKVEERRQKSKNQSVGKPLVGGPFSLVDHEGNPVTDMDYRGKYMLLYFGYTFCPDVCPEELEKMAAIVDLFDKKENHVPYEIVPIFISCDPKRDSVQSIREYIREFHPKFVGLTGTYNQIRKVAKAYRLYFSAPPKAVDDDETDYLVDHSIFFYLVDPSGRYQAHFGKQETAESVVAKIKDAIAEYNSQK
ncbi:thioredoxin-like protein [Polychytrium aggregatum]|uniref:thioredoxin-like protein n=1 Tax=Polychytrium aggregatum TaxID=110093 RepID=UPI0022FEF845|nr:thioredoxin-like protein [Polychytrium aggregatum]KAI9204276.1 thioredoxin-like protein [Polychytrium aggregatum]